MAVRQIDVASGLVTTLAGTLTSSGYADGVGADVLFNSPYGVALQAAGTMAVIVRLHDVSVAVSHTRNALSRRSRSAVRVGQFPHSTN